MPEPDPPPKYEKVQLKGMDDYDFETLCGVILRRHGHGEFYHMPKGPDDSKDLIFTKGKHKTYVECKHRPNQKISVLMIRNLHSSSQTDKATDSIFMTTGGYSAEAILKAKKVDPPMRLIDGNELAMMAHQVGIMFDWGPRPEDDCPFMYIPQDQAAWEFLEAELDKMVKIQWPWENQKDTRSKMHFVPYYRLDYSIPRDKYYRRAGRTTTHVLVDAYLRTLFDNIGRNSVAVLRGEEVDACFGAPLRMLNRWTPVMKRIYPNLDFVLPENDVRRFAFEEEQRILKAMGIKPGQVRLKNIHRIMVPWYNIERQTPYGNASVTTICGKYPFLLNSFRF